jgi:hypothetical protein
VSCKAISIPELARTTPVTPPTVNKKIKPIAKSPGVLKSIDPPHNVASQLKILIPVGIAIIIVAAVK